MNRNRRANAGPVATTGNGTYGQFYQRDASGAYPGDLRTMGVGGVPGRRVPPFTGASPGANASAAPGRGQPFAATNARVTATTGTSERTRRTNPNRSRRPPPRDPPRRSRAARVAQRSGFDISSSRAPLPKLYRLSSAERTPATDFSGKRAVASIVRTSRDATGNEAPPPMNDALVRRTVNQLSVNQLSLHGTVPSDPRSSAHGFKSSQTSFDATTAMPRRKSPEESASGRPAWDSSARGPLRGGGALLAANQNSFADAASMRRDPTPARATLASKTGDRAAAWLSGASNESVTGSVTGPASYVTGRLSPSASMNYSSSTSPGSSGRASPTSYPDAYPSPRGFGPKELNRVGDSTNGSGSGMNDASKFGTYSRGSNGWGKRGDKQTNATNNARNTLSPGSDFSSSPTRSPTGLTGGFGRSTNPYAARGGGSVMTSVTSVTSGTVQKSVPVGVASLAGGSAGAAKENQDAHFHLDRLGSEPSPGYEPSGSHETYQADGAHDFAAGVLDGHGVAGAKVSSFVRSKIASEIEAQSRSAGFSADKDLVNDPRGADAGHVSAISAATVVTVLKDAFGTAQKSLLRAHGADCAESGSTCVVCVRRGDNLIVANVGDSRCVLGRRVVAGSNPGAGGGGGRDVPFASGFGRASGGSKGCSSYVAVDLSVDHKPDRPDEAARVARAGGVVEPARALHGGHAGPARVWRRFPRAGGLAVSRAFGDSQLTAAGVVAVPEIKSRRVAADDAFVVLASDGVWDHVSSAEAVRIVGECVDSQAVTHRGAVTHRAGAGGNDVWARAADAVARKAAEGWRRSLGGVYRDDITCVVVPILH